VSKNVSQGLARRMSEVSGIPCSGSIGQYLGIPALRGRPWKSYFSHILDQSEAPDLQVGRPRP